MIGGVDPARLYSALLNTGLQSKDPPLYQVIYQLIGQMIKLTVNTAGITSGGGSGATIQNITQVIQRIDFGDGGGGGGGDGDVGPPGLRGIEGVNGMVPYYIGPGNTFTVPLYKQALFEMNIDNEGFLDVEGFLIEVD